MLKPVSPTILHIPHASLIIPLDIRPSILLSDADLQTELITLTDAFTDELFVADFAKARAVIFPVSRLVVDPERFIDDNKEIMAVRGMGVIYTRASTGRPLRYPPTSEERTKLINQYYQPHHQKFENSVSSALEHFGKCMIIDCHSFPSTPLPYEEDQNPDRPEICIGTDSFHTSSWLEEKVAMGFDRLGFSVEINRPFAGSIVPMRYFQKDSRVSSVMIELNRKLYMDEFTGKKNHRFDELKNILQRIIRGLELLALQ